MLKILSAAALTLSVTGAAFAQTANSPRLEDPAMMSPFYTDEGMTELRGAGEFDSAFKNLSSEDKAAIMTECENVNTQRENFCTEFKRANSM